MANANPKPRGIEPKPNTVDKGTRKTVLKTVTIALVTNDPNGHRMLDDGHYF